MLEVGHILLIISLIIFIICLITIFLLLRYQIVKNFLHKIEESNKLLEKNIRLKYDLVIRSINIIERKLKLASKKFDEIKKINIEKLNNIEIDRILTDCSTEILQIQSDYPKLSNVKSFNEIIEDIKNAEIHLISLRTFYNKNVAEYNHLLKSFPINIISKCKKLKFKFFFEGKEMDENKKI